VSTSSSGSPAVTRCPSRLSQRTRRALSCPTPSDGITTCTAIRPAAARSPCRPDPHRLHVLELVQAELGELAPVAGPLDAAEGQPGVRGDDAVDEDHPRVDLPSEAPASLGAPRPDAGAEAVAR